MEGYHGITVSLWKLDGTGLVVVGVEVMELVVRVVEVDVGFVGCVVVVVVEVRRTVERVR